MLSKTCKYAVRAAIYLTVNSGDKKKTGIKVIAKELDIPSPFLGKILQTLVKYKILSSAKGPYGGFGLAKNADDITLYDIVVAIDGTDLFRQCLISTRTCFENRKQCALHSRYKKISREIRHLFKSYSLQDLATEIKNDEKMFYL